MPQPDQREIEKLLKAAGARRLGQAGKPVMHSAVRETLQTEVRRTHGAEARPKRNGLRWFLRLLPKVTVFIALAACAWLFFYWESGDAPGPLAKNESRLDGSLVQDERVESPAPAPVASRSPMLEESDSVKQKLEPAAPQAVALSPSTNEMVAASSVPAGRNDSPHENSKSVVGADYFKADRQGMYLGMASTEADLETSLNRDTSLTMDALMETKPAGAVAPASNAIATSDTRSQTPVLQNFMVVNKGSSVRLIDADGSTYEGQLQPLTASAPQTSPTSAGPAASVRAAAPAPVPVKRASAPAPSLQMFSIIASGTNRSLNQAVEFTGNLSLTEQQLQQGRNQFYNTLAPLPGQTIDSAAAASAAGGRLQGSALLGNGQDVAVDAAPTPP